MPLWQLPRSPLYHTPNLSSHLTHRCCHHTVWIYQRFIRAGDGDDFSAGGFQYQFLEFAITLVRACPADKN
jgi:hypothetical protein